MKRISERCHLIQYICNRRLTYSFTLVAWHHDWPHLSTWLFGLLLGQWIWPVDCSQPWWSLYDRVRSEQFSWPRQAKRRYNDMSPAYWTSRWGSLTDNLLGVNFPMGGCNECGIFWNNFGTKQEAEAGWWNVCLSGRLLSRELHFMSWSEYRSAPHFIHDQYLFRMGTCDVIRNPATSSNTLYPSTVPYIFPKDLFLLLSLNWHQRPSLLLGNYQRVQYFHLMNPCVPFLMLSTISLQQLLPKKIPPF